MVPFGSCKCLHCGSLFREDARNRGRQRYCAAVVCRKESKAASQRRWLEQPANVGYFQGEANAQRVREWQAAHPGYWKRRRRRPAVVLQDPSTNQVPEDEPVTKSDISGVLQDPSTDQTLLLLGLVAHLAGSVLQEDIAETARSLQSRGRAVMGNDVCWPVYAKTSDRPPTPAARAGPI
jgi:hypothetical protein